MIKNNLKVETNKDWIIKVKNYWNKKMVNHFIKYLMILNIKILNLKDQDHLDNFLIRKWIKIYLWINKMMKIYIFYRTNKNP
jgi:hypothetical protein